MIVDYEEEFTESGLVRAKLKASASIAPHGKQLAANKPERGKEASTRKRKVSV